jgi:hypothetical protein
MPISMGNRNHSIIIELSREPQKTPGNMRCFYRHFWKQK